MAPQTPSRQTGAVAGQSLLSLHCTQTRSRQRGAVVGHSLSLSHCTQRPPSQNGVGAPHSALVMQATQSPFEQNGVGALQAAFEVQPFLHSLSPLQIGADAGQSRLDRHCTQRLSRPKQNGAALPQCVFTVHETHCFVIGSQIGRGEPAQSASPAQPIH